MKQIYLDYAAATPMDPKVLAAMKPYFSGKFHNPSATYLAARQVRQGVEAARASVAGWLGAKPAEIIFTAGATEANNLAIQGVMAGYPESEVLISAVEHESVLEPAGLFKHKKIPVDKHGLIILNKLSKLISEKTVLISIVYVSNELGTVQPLPQIAAVINDERKSRLRKGNKTPLWLHTDAAQAPSYFDLHAARLGVDLMSLNGGKIYGPKQSGALYISSKVNLKPLILGGGQERNLRSGTEDVPAIIGLARALDMAQHRRKAENQRIKKLTELFIGQISEQIPKATINGSQKRRSPHIVNISFGKHDNERLMMQLDETGIACAIGSACSAANVEPSHVLKAIGLSDQLARSSLRFSFGRATKASDIRKTIETLVKLTRQ